MKEYVSIVIPAFNSSSTVVKAIEASLSQEYERADIELEVIVVDDGSTDNTREILKNYPIIYLFQPNRGPASARNRGWRASRGNIICFTDADCIPEKDWVYKLIKNYDFDKIGAVGGSYAIANAQSIIADCIHQEIIARHKKMPRLVKALGSYNLSVKKTVLEAAGGFDETYRFASGEDNDLSYKITAAGFLLVFDRDALVKHYHPQSLWRYLKSQFQHGFWRVNLYLGHPKMSSGDDYSNIADYIQPLLAVFILLLLPFCLFLPQARLSLLFFLLAQIVLQIPVFICVFNNRPKARYLYLPAITFLRSFSRGLGMCLGIYNFIILKKIYYERTFSETR